MFSKLLKYEWKANWGLMSILTLAAFGVALLGTIALRVLVNYGDRISESESILVLLLFPLGVLVMVSYVVIAIYVAAVNYVLLFRFYKNKFTDEGYLTFTLPVKTNHIFLSSGLHMAIWMVISIVLMVLMYALMFLCGTATEGLINTDILKTLQTAGELWEVIADGLSDILGQGFGPLLLLNILIAPFSSVVQSMSCVTLGAVVAKKHKILAIIGIFYGVNMILSVVTSVLANLPSLLLIADPSLMDSTNWYFTLIMALVFLLQAGITVGGYFLSTHLMKNKLNLP